MKLSLAIKQPLTKKNASGNSQSDLCVYYAATHEEERKQLLPKWPVCLNYSATHEEERKQLLPKRSVCLLCIHTCCFVLELTHGLPLAAGPFHTQSHVCINMYAHT